MKYTGFDKQALKAVSDAVAKQVKERMKDAGSVKSVNGAIPDKNGNVQIEVSGTLPEPSTTLMEPATDDLPVVYLDDGVLPTTKTSTTMSFEYFSRTAHHKGYVDIKCQGTSSMGYPKKNFTFKFFKDAEKTEKLKINFRGWGAQNKFCAKANWIDISHARNVVSARIWGDIVKSRENYDQLPEELKTSPNMGAIDGFPILVYANGVYQGRYTLNIPKDAWMFGMDDEREDHCVLCGEGNNGSLFRETSYINGYDWSDEIHDEAPESIKRRWNEVIDFVKDSNDETFKRELGNYIDVDSCIDYLIYGLAHCGLDAFCKNQLYLTYDGTLWYASMYDLDSTWGLYWNGDKFVSPKYKRTEFEDYQGGRTGNLLYIRLADVFAEEIKTRYLALRTGALSTTNIIQHFEAFMKIVSNDIVAEDYAPTTAGGAFTEMPSTGTNNLHQIRQYIVDRLAYVDQYITDGDPEEKPGENPGESPGEDPKEEPKDDSGTPETGGGTETPGSETSETGEERDPLWDVLGNQEITGLLQMSATLNRPLNYDGTSFYEEIKSVKLFKDDAPYTMKLAFRHDVPDGKSYCLLSSCKEDSSGKHGLIVANYGGSEKLLRVDCGSNTACFNGNVKLEKGKTYKLIVRKKADRTLDAFIGDGKTWYQTLWNSLPIAEDRMDKSLYLGVNDEGWRKVDYFAGSMVHVTYRGEMSDAQVREEMGAN